MKKKSGGQVSHSYICLNVRPEPFSVAVLAQMEGRGHTCLPLQQLLGKSLELLGLPSQESSMILPQTLSAWLADLQASPLLGMPQPDQAQPLVLGLSNADPLLYLRRYYRYEQLVAVEVLRRSASVLPVERQVARQWLDSLFMPSEAEVDWQKLACAMALRAGLTIITGGPGTGKTYTAARLLALLFAMHPDPARLRVALAAPTGKAAARLRLSIDVSLQELCTRLGSRLDLAAFTARIGAARTLHSLLGARPDTRQFAYNASNLLDVDILIVDEASMIHLEMMSALLQAMPPGAKLILLGDKDQLASVEAGAVLGDLCRDAHQGHYDLQTQAFAKEVAGVALPDRFLSPDATRLAQQTVMLRESRRFEGGIGQLALAVNAGNRKLAQTLLAQDKSGMLYATPNATVASVLALAVQGRRGAEVCYAQYLELIRARTAQSVNSAASHEAWAKAVLRAYDNFRILCAVHEGDWGTINLNQSVQQALAEQGLLKPVGQWFAGRPVMVTQNDHQQGIFNGDIGVTLPGLQDSSALRVYFLNGDSLRSISVSRLAHVESAFAMTVHKSQGSEFLHTALVLPEGGAKVLTRELVYTGITRARQHFTLFEGSQGLLQMAIARQSQRASGLALQLEQSR